MMTACKNDSPAEGRSRVIFGSGPLRVTRERLFATGPFLGGHANSSFGRNSDLFHSAGVSVVLRTPPLLDDFPVSPPSWRNAAPSRAIAGTTPRHRPVAA